MEFFSTSNIFAPGNGQKDTDGLLLQALKMRVFACTITSDLKILDIKKHYLLDTRHSVCKLGLYILH